MTYTKRFISLFSALAVIAGAFVLPVNATVSDALQYAGDSILQWMNPSNTEPLGGWNIVDFGSALFQSNKNQKYYTTPTQSVEDSNGNVTNYYRGGDTTNTKIIDSYNRTFNTIHNTNNYTNNYSANVKLNDFLNTYTTYNNDYTYSAELKSWYYDNDTNNYNYTSNQTYYNTDNSKYYISIDNSTDEYYLVDIQYSPTFVTVNYEYNTTNNVSNNYGDVTNIYYYELDDGRNSYTLTVSEALGIASGYDVTNYELVHDDPDTLSLQHFDADYTDSSAYGRQYFSVNRSTSFVDSGAFGKAVKLSSGSGAGVTIPNLSSFSSLQIDFRAYYDSIDSLQVFLGDTVLFGNIPDEKRNTVSLNYDDHGDSCTWTSSSEPRYGSISLLDSISPSFSSSYSLNVSDLPITPSNNYGYYVNTFGSVQLNHSWDTESAYVNVDDYDYSNGVYSGTGTKYHTLTTQAYQTFTGNSVVTSAQYSSLSNQWVSFRISISGSQIYYFVNGDLVGSGFFSMPSADKVYILSQGTVYLDELRVSTGTLVSTSVYTPSSAPYDTNMVLALPDELVANTIYVRHQTAVNAWRIGGVRPSAPATGFFYVPLHSDYTASQPLLYDGSNWVEVDAVVSTDGVTTVSVVGFRFIPASGSTDVNPDLQPVAPDAGGSGEDSGGSSGSDSDDNVNEDSTLISGLFKKLFLLIESVIGSVFDGLISLATSVIERLTSVVNIFGSFGESLSALWTWLPPEIVSVLVTAVTVIIFVALIKIVL